MTVILTKLRLTSSNVVGMDVPRGWPIPSESVVETARLAVASVLENRDATVDDLIRFYDPDGNYAGPVFDCRDGVEADDIAALDLVAITTMQVEAGPRAVRRFLRHGDDRRALLDALEKTPDVSLWNADSQQLEAAARLYRLTKGIFSGGNMWVSASKLCARKRPRLIPVRDSVIVDGLELPNEDFREDWLIIRRVISDPDIRHELLRCAAFADADRQLALLSIPELRLLDVVLWMRWSRSGQASGTAVRAPIHTPK
jgi:hypothetical protein